MTRSDEQRWFVQHLESLSRHRLEDPSILVVAMDAALEERWDDAQRLWYELHVTYSRHRLGELLQTATDTLSTWQPDILQMSEGWDVLYSTMRRFVATEDLRADFGVRDHHDLRAIRVTYEPHIHLRDTYTWDLSRSPLLWYALGEFRTAHVLIRATRQYDWRPRNMGSSENIRRALLSVPGVTGAHVSVTGPHEYSVLVTGGDDHEVYDVVERTRPMGVRVDVLRPRDYPDPI